MTDIKNWRGWDPARHQNQNEQGTRERKATELDKWIEDATRRACGIKDDAVVAGGDTRNPNILIVGKAPAEDEVKQGRPFVGPSGGPRGLERMLKPTGTNIRFGGGAIATNAGFWLARPGQDPTTSECAWSAPIIAELIEKMKPRVILALGAKAAESLTSIAGSVASLRGRWHKCTLSETNAMVRVTYHPAYLLREPRAWHRAEADMDVVGKYMKGLE